MDKIEHFSHTHPLLLKEEQKHDGKQVFCSGCEKPISGPVYCCTQCNYVLHKSCAELPRQMRDPRHPQHPLTLLPTSPYSGAYICDACRDIYKNFVYHCSLCQYDLDMSCATLWHPDDGHLHGFISLTNPQSFVCYACGEEASESFPCRCNTCQILVHSSCAELPQTIRINGHHHLLKLIYSLHKVYGFRDDISCNVCNEKMSTTFAGYFCSICRYPVHLKCAEQHSNSKADWETETAAAAAEEEEEEEEGEGEEEEQEDESDYSDPESEKSYVGTETDHPQDSLISHNHALELTFMEEQSLQCGDDKLCDGCIRPVTLPFFSCAENCGFFIHQSCAELPRMIEHQFHPHPLTLLSKAPHYDSIFRCDGCKSLSNGFVYRCEECQFDLDVCCGSLPETLEHESHKHPLRLKKASIPMQCKGCGLRSKHVFACDACEDFAIDCGCATMPSTAWHVYDKHPLFLTYIVEGYLRQYTCAICKEKRSQKQWIYYCDDCDFAAHPNCVIGKPKRVKFGGTFQYDVHSHPLAFVEEIRQHPPCEACGERCNGWTLECGQCKCYFHREGQCFWEQFKQSTKYLAFSGTMMVRYAANILAATPNVTTK